jgi:two-component system nitrate/nitrite response regulator NarL
MAGHPLVLIVDAHALIASSLAMALRYAGFERVATVDPRELELDAPSVTPSAGDLVLVGLLYGDGRTTLPLIARLAGQGCRVIVMASDQGLPLTGECLHRLSAGGHAMTEDERSALLETVERHEAAEQALHRPFRGLTDRESAVFAALVEGLAPKQIAHRDGIAVSTVRGHIHGVLSKLEVSSQREALAMARHAGWPPGGKQSILTM